MPTFPKQADFSGVLNPKRVIEKRLAGAESPLMEVSPSEKSLSFTKPFTPAEREKQTLALKRFLANRSKE